MNFNSESETYELRATEESAWVISVTNNGDDEGNSNDVVSYSFSVQGYHDEQTEDITS